MAQSCWHRTYTVLTRIAHTQCLVSHCITVQARAADVLSWVRPRAAAVRSLRMRGVREAESEPSRQARLMVAAMRMPEPHLERLSDFTGCAPLRLVCKGQVFFGVLLQYAHSPYGGMWFTGTAASRVLSGMAWHKLCAVIQQMKSRAQLLCGSTA